MKMNLDYVLISYYEDDCNGYQPNWTQVFTQLQGIFPNSYIGWGEAGTINATAKSSYVYRYYSSTFPTLPKFILGVFWWYFDSNTGSANDGDLVPSTQPLLCIMNKAIALSLPSSCNPSPVTTS